MDTRNTNNNSRICIFKNNDEPDWNEICKNKYIIYKLQYSEKHTCVKENDLYFIKWQEKHNEKIKLSKAIRNGNKIKILEGP